MIKLTPGQTEEGLRDYLSEVSAEHRNDPVSRRQIERSPAEAVTGV